MDNGTDYIIANLQARATAAEAQNAVLREALREALDLAEGLNDSHDYLGPGSNSNIADKEYAEDAATIKRIRAALQETANGPD